MNPLHLEEQLLHLPLEAMGGLAREIKGIILTYTIIILTISKDIYIFTIWENQYESMIILIGIIVRIIFVAQLRGRFAPLGNLSNA